ncbi:uncharacterized protein PHALS_00442 [Plasmopara halstedii]|uniref:RxLR-like protein n=1 Tax=Plasmopara halstedii TaxID=4781 RepID=A0A0P1A6A0_PLAHL|nr:uncharacterized protein PHALS_00442 [Plasmopara halstedii]CEG36124.1 hypothetical protein PHALS_00442 [Plasmopara halstedii]|eukprot:XP_024572493.1 hypothetical protein PHALS_00442 [Plasmopara halstedii]
MKIYHPVLAAAILTMTLPLTSGTAVIRENSSLQNSLTGGVNDNKLDLSAKILDIEHEEVHNNSQVEDEEKTDETAKTGTAEDNTFQDGLLASTAPSSAKNNALSGDVANVKKTWRGGFDREKASAQTGDFNLPAEESIEEEMDELDKSQPKEEENAVQTEKIMISKEETTKDVMTAKDENLTAAAESRTAVFNTSSANAVHTSSPLNDIEIKDDSSTQEGGANSSAENLDENRQDEHNTSHDDEGKEFDGTVKHEDLEEETAEKEAAKDEHSVATTSSKIAMANNSSVNQPLVGNVNGDEVNPQNLTSTMAPPTIVEPIEVTNGAEEKKESEETNQDKDEIVLSNAESAAGEGENEEESNKDEESFEENAQPRNEDDSEEDSSDE